MIYDVEKKNLWRALCATTILGYHRVMVGMAVWSGGCVCVCVCAGGVSELSLHTRGEERRARDACWDDLKMLVFISLSLKLNCRELV